MLKIKSVRLQHWCQHTDTTVQFGPNTNGILGPNGRGKSNLVGGILTGLTGKCQSGTLFENIQNGHDKASILVGFECNGVDGEVYRTFTRLQDGNVSTTARMRYGDVKTTGVNPTTAEIARITGFSPRIMQDHVFIAQAALNELLFQKNSDKLASFLALIPGINKTEFIRAALQQELNRYPEIVIAGDPELLEKELRDIKTVMTTLEQEQAEFVAALQGIDPQDIARQRKAHQDRAELEAKIRLNRAQMIQYSETVDKLVKELDKLKATPMVAPQDSERDTITKQLSQNAEAIKIEARCTALNVELLKTQAYLKKLHDTPIPEPDLAWEKYLPVLQAEHATLTGELGIATKTLQVLKQPGGKCPTCLRGFENREALERSLTETVARLTPRIKELAALTSQYTRDAAQYTRDADQHRVNVLQTERDVERLTRELAGITRMAVLDAAQIDELEQFMLQHDLAAQAARRYAEQVSRLSAQRDSAQQVHDTAKVAWQKAADELAKLPSIMSIKELDEIDESYRAISERCSVLSNELKLRGEQADRLQRQINEIQDQLSRQESVMRYRGLLQAARDTLHRDQLPSMLLRQYVARLDELCNRYLALFGNPYAVSIQDDMEITCTMPTGYTTAANRLSGGQKCVLSVVMRFAINELFARDIGLLVLDEPTEFMDEDNVQYVGELVEQIQKVGKTSGVQTIVITHAKDLIPSFDHVIQL